MAVKKNEGDGPEFVEIGFTPEDREELKELLGEAAKVIGVRGDAEPADIVQAAATEIDRLRKSEDEIAEDAAISLSFLYGEQFVRAAGWEWTMLLDGEDSDDAEDEEIVAVVAPDRSASILPVVHLIDLIDDPKAPNDVKTLFERVLKSKAPGGPAGSLRRIG